MITTFDPTALAEPVQSTVDAYQAATGAAAIVARVSGPSQTAVDAAGLTDLATGKAALPEQTFEVGSQTKMMTATIILQLVGEGKLDLDASAASYLPAATIAGITNAETATVRQLLNMTSGIANYTDVPSAADPEVPAFVQALLDHPDRLFDAADALDLVRGRPADFAPGASFNYSNTNYALLGQIIEQQTGQSFAASLQQRIFDPLGMTSSTTDAAPIDASRLHSYVTLPDGDVLDVTSTGWLKGAEGGVVSTTADMTRFLKALLVDKSLLPPDLLAEMTDNAIDTSAGGVQSSFGLGIASFRIDGIGWVSGFTGGTLGTDSSTYVDLATGRIIAVGITAADANSPALVNELWLATRTGAWNAVAFDPAADVVRIDNASAASAAIATGDDTILKFGPASLTLASSLGELTTSNIRFADGSVLVVGDNAGGSAGDEAANSIDIARQFAAADGKSNQLLGLGGNDRLLGGSGADRILGGEGDDTIDGRAGNDRLSDGAGDDQIRGGDGHDVITTGAGSDRYAGGTGTDTLSFAGSPAAVRVDLSKGTAFGLGADTISGIENVTGSRLADRIHGHDGVNVLRGLAGNDVLAGGNGADRLDGGIGRDLLVGGHGGDRFVYRDAAESPSGAGRDVIRDFDTDGDRIDLSGIDANRGRTGDQAFKFIDGHAFQGVAGELRVSTIDRPGRSSDVTVVAADIDGDGRADFQVELAGLHDLSSSDFVL